MLAVIIFRIKNIACKSTMVKSTKRLRGGLKVGKEALVISTRNGVVEAANCRIVKVSKPDIKLLVKEGIYISKRSYASFGYVAFKLL